MIADQCSRDRTRGGGAIAGSVLDPELARAIALADPVVSGPSLFGFILKNWDPLTAGATLPVRMLVLKDKTTYGFDLKLEKQAKGHTSFTLTPSNLLIRLAVAPLRVVFDTSARTVARYEGRVPPMESVAGKLKDLDAYFSPSWTAFQAERGRDFSVIVDGISN